LLDQGKLPNQGKLTDQEKQTDKEKQPDQGDKVKSTGQLNYLLSLARIGFMKTLSMNPSDISACPPLVTQTQPDLMLGDQLERHP